MKGVSYLVDDDGNKTAVILDLAKHRRLWEDIYDQLLVESRRRESRTTFKKVASLLNSNRRTS